MRFFIGLRNALPAALLLWALIIWGVMKLTTGCAFIEKRCWVNDDGEKECWKGLLVKDGPEEVEKRERGTEEGSGGKAGRD